MYISIFILINLLVASYSYFFASFWSLRILKLFFCLITLISRLRTWTFSNSFFISYIVLVFSSILPLIWSSYLSFCWIEFYMDILFSIVCLWVFWRLAICWASLLWDATNKSINLRKLLPFPALRFSTFGRCFYWIVSLFSTALSIFFIISYCLLRSYSYLSSIIWIYFFIATISCWPILGSRASCISFSNWIFLSHSNICLSVSTISAKTSALLYFKFCIFVSSLRLSFSSYFNLYTN